MSETAAWLLGVLPVATFLAGYAIGHERGNKRAWRDARRGLLKEDT